MRLKLTQPGFATYTGQMGVVTFTNGLSDAPVRLQDAIRMAAVMQCEWEDGSSASVAQAILNHAHTPATIQVVNELNGDLALAAAQAEANGKAPVAPLSDVPPVEVERYTAAELEAIADRDGIKGLRVIATPLNLKGNSITELIRAIVSAGAVKV